MRKAGWVLIWLLLWAAPGTGAENDGPKRKELNFEGEIIEGAARQPLDSLSQVADRAGKARVHLYERHLQFREINLERVEEIVETYR